MDEAAHVKQIGRARAFYDRYSATFLACAGDTFQAGLARVGEFEEPRASNLYFAARAGIQSGQRVLDAGCGVCGPSIHIAAAHPGLRLDAVTISPVQVRLARERVSLAGLTGRITVHEADYHLLPFEEATFDVVFYLESTGYSHDWTRLYREAHRVLRPGGTVYIKDVFQLSEPQTEQERREQRAFDELWGLHQSPTLPGVAAILRQVGFEDVCARALENIGSAHFLSSMFGGQDVSPFELNALGRNFFRPMQNLPSLFGEVIARKRV